MLNADDMLKILSKEDTLKDYQHDDYDFSELTLPMSKDRGFLLPATSSWLTSPFLVGRSARYGCVITPHRAEHIAPYAVCLVLLPPTYSVELQILIAPSKSLWVWNPHLHTYFLSFA